MRIGLHARPEVSAFRAIAAGLAAHGCTAVWQRPSLWREANAPHDLDVAVVCGMSREAGRIAAFYRARTVPVWIVELPRLREEIGASSLLLNDLHWLPATGKRPVVAPPILSARRPVALLVTPQKADDAAHGMNGPALERWIRDTVTDCRAWHPDLPVHVRPHPRTGTKVPADRWGADLAVTTGEDLRTTFASAAAVITFNSTTGWDAIAAGVPVVSTAPTPACSYASYTTTLRALEPLPARRRTEALRRAAASQWTMGEMADGTAVGVMLRAMASPAAQ